MSTPSASLEGFAYGEHLEGLPPRSLGYRLLAPPGPAPWCAEVEALARRLQGAPYPDHWPPADLFCSVLLADGRRLIAVARYGLADHTPSRRRGGLELVGAVGPGDLDVPTSLAVYRWLGARRAGADDLHALGDRFALADALAAPAPAASDPVPVLPIRLWQEGALLFAATAPSDPDHRLGLLEQGAGRGWQWLPLVGPDFPLAAYAQRGPLVAWTPHLAGVAVKVDRKQAEDARRPDMTSRFLPRAVVSMFLVVVRMVGATFWETSALRERVRELHAELAATAAHTEGTPPTQSQGPPPQAPDESRARFRDALHDLLRERIGAHDWEEVRPYLLAAYERAARQRPDLRLKDSDLK
ncbi:MAG TPA: hypothetical protein VFW33_22095, partial [Gemmataceae bacterium]|nr:hypothetical protein [Gemmataceae bacterium]